MVVEDDQEIKRIVEEALSDGGFEPAIASSGEEALALLSGPESKNAYRALVIDIKLGKDGIRGWDVARRAPELARNLYYWARLDAVMMQKRKIRTPSHRATTASTLQPLICCYTVAETERSVRGSWLLRAA